MYKAFGRIGDRDKDACKVPDARSSDGPPRVQDLQTAITMR